MRCYPVRISLLDPRRISSVGCASSLECNRGNRRYFCLALAKLNPDELHRVEMWIQKSRVV